MSDLNEKLSLKTEADDDNHRIGASVASGSLACAIISALFAFAVAVVMFTDYYRLVTVKPLTLPALAELRSRSDANPGDEQLKREIRELDLAARTAYFSTVANFRSGAFLLAAGAFVALVSFHIYLFKRPKPVSPPKRPARIDPLVSAAKSRYYIVSAVLWGMAGFSILLFLFPAVSQNTSRSVAKENINSRKTVADDFSDVSTAQQTFSDDVFAENWPGFRGYRGSAIVADSSFKYPIRWKTGEGMAWKTTLPSTGFSSPIYWKGKLFMTGGDKKHREVFCVDSSSGKIVWRSEIPFMAPAGTAIPRVTNDTGYAAPTMATDGIRVFAIFATGDIAALTIDGEFIWKKSLGVPVNHYAFASSLTVADGKLIVQLYNSEEPRLLALDPATGGILWTNRSAKEISWSSPVIAEIAGQLVAIVQSSVAILAVSVSDGRTLWRTECLAGEVAPCPAVVDGRVFAANDNASALALDLATGKLLWNNEDTDLPEVASVLATREGRVYLAASFGPLTCLDAATGKVVWVHEFETGFYSSPILLGKMIYLLDMKGKMSIIEDSAKFKLHSTFEIGEPCVCTPVFADGNIYIRAGKHLYKLK